MKPTILIPFLMTVLACHPPVEQNSAKPLEKNKKIARDWAKKDEFADFWIYGDLQAGFAEAKRTGKPLLINYRCVP